MKREPPQEEILGMPCFVEERGFTIEELPLHEGFGNQIIEARSDALWVRAARDKGLWEVSLRTPYGERHPAFLWAALLAQHPAPEEAPPDADDAAFVTSRLRDLIAIAGQPAASLDREIRHIGAVRAGKVLGVPPKTLERVESESPRV